MHILLRVTSWTGRRWRCRKRRHSGLGAGERGGIQAPCGTGGFGQSPMGGREQRVGAGIEGVLVPGWEDEGVLAGLLLFSEQNMWPLKVVRGM